MSEGRRRIPAWLVGLIVAAVIFAAILLLADTFGFGDDPVIDSLGAGY